MTLLQQICSLLVSFRGTEVNFLKSILEKIRIFKFTILQKRSLLTVLNQEKGEWHA